MQKWEYQIIEVLKGEIETVNGNLVSKTPIKGLSGGERFKLTEYLSSIGDDGWEIVGVGAIALLLSKSYAHTPYQSVLIAKRLKE